MSWRTNGHPAEYTHNNTTIAPIVSSGVLINFSQSHGLQIQQIHIVFIVTTLRNKSTSQTNKKHAKSTRPGYLIVKTRRNRFQLDSLHNGRLLI